MKKLGLVGGTGPATTCRYYLGVIEAVSPRLPSGHIPCINIESVDCGALFEAMAKPTLDEVAALMTEAARKLSIGGADVIAFAGFSAHLVLDQVRKALPQLEIVSILEPTAELAKKRGWRKLGLLANARVSASKTLFSSFEENGITLFRPNAAEAKHMNHLVETEVEFGVNNSASQLWFGDLADRLSKDYGIEALLLANTDFPQYFEHIPLSVEKIDPVALHIAALADCILT